MQTPGISDGAVSSPARGPRRPNAAATRWGISTFVYRLILLILGVLILPGLFGCQGQSPWKGSVKIGLIVPFYGYDSGSAEAAYFATKLAIKERNESGGIGGRWIELVALDDQNDREAAADRAKEMVQDPDVLGVIAHLNSDTALSAASVYREAGLAAITLGGSSAELASTYPELYRIAPGDADIASRSLEVLTSRQRLRRIALVHDSSLGHSSTAGAFLAEAERLNLDVSAVERIGRDDREFGQFLDALSFKPPELLIIVGDQFQAASLATQARQNLKDVRILIAGCANTPDFAKIVGDDARGVLHVDHALAVNEGVADRFAARFRSTFGMSPNPHAFAAHDAAGLILGAMAKAGTQGGILDRASVSRELRKSGSDVDRSGTREFGDDGGRLGMTSSLYEIDKSGYPGSLWR